MFPRIERSLPSQNKKTRIKTRLRTWRCPCFDMEDSIRERCLERHDGTHVDDLNPFEEQRTETYGTSRTCGITQQPHG